ncbi:hypothetical protein AGMMS49921_08480 [Endomicrobiia bacterium]|nr:hypothetical protein AGMMS49921_08480 [Endomicrobiia bacterium]
MLSSRQDVVKYFKKDGENSKEVIIDNDCSDSKNKSVSVWKGKKTSKDYCGKNIAKETVKIHYFTRVLFGRVLKNNLFKNRRYQSSRNRMVPSPDEKYYFKLFPEQNLLKNNKGQTLYYFLILVVIFVISFAMMLNIANLIRNRMIMQNKADNIALSLATHKARVLNFLGGTNYLMGTALSLGMNPRGIQLSSYSTDAIGGFPATMLLHQKTHFQI